MLDKSHSLLSTNSTFKERQRQRDEERLKETDRQADRQKDRQKGNMQTERQRETGTDTESFANQLPQTQKLTFYFICQSGTTLCPIIIQILLTQLSRNLRK